MKAPRAASALAVLALCSLLFGLMAVVGTSRNAPVGASYWLMVGAISALLSGAAVAVIRKSARRTAPGRSSPLLRGRSVDLGRPGAARMGLASDARVVAPRGSGALSVVAQLGFTWSMRYVRAAPAGIIQQLTPVGALGLGWLVYGDRIPPLSAAGAVLTLTGVSWGAWHISRDVLPEDA
ncbi:MAG: DMT family transporter [Deltaproteobacteria bacterium]|nr:MAG: DMT family transporter [Deltaproteobacteria bacterium]